jgi:hypothetical protein
MNEDAVPEAVGHPQDMKAIVDFRLGRWLSLQASARITPAGLMAVGATTALLAFACYRLSRTRR